MGDTSSPHPYRQQLHPRDIQNSNSLSEGEEGEAWAMETTEAMPDMRTEPDTPEPITTTAATPETTTKSTTTTTTTTQTTTTKKGLGMVTDLIKFLKSSKFLLEKEISMKFSSHLTQNYILPVSKVNLNSSVNKSIIIYQ